MPFLSEYRLPPKDYHLDVKKAARLLNSMVRKNDFLRPMPLPELCHLIVQKIINSCGNVEALRIFVEDLSIRNPDRFPHTFHEVITEKEVIAKVLAYVNSLITLLKHPESGDNCRMYDANYSELLRTAKRNYHLTLPLVQNLPMMYEVIKSTPRLINCRIFPEFA